MARKSWEELDARGKRRVEMLISTLTEIEAGWQHSGQVLESGEKLGHDEQHPLNRFMAHSVVHFVCETFMGSTAGAQDVLRSVGLEPAAQELDSILAKKVGRNTTVAHPTFDPKHVLNRVFDPASLEDPIVEGQYRSALGEFMKTVRIVHVLLRKLYPLAAASADLPWQPADKSPS